MGWATYSYLIAPGLFLGVLLMLEIGHRLAVRRGAAALEESGVSAIDGAMLGLMGLMIAFTFSGAMTRFDARRELVVQEANAIGTAWLRIETLPAAAQPPMRELFREYLDSRMEVYRRIPDLQGVKDALVASAAIQQKIWSSAVAATREPEGQRAIMIVLPALNEMIDITSTRTAAALFHPPGAVFGMLFGVILISSLLAGYDMTAKLDATWIHRLVFALIAALIVYVILDIEHGRIGLIRVDAADQFLIELRESMGSEVGDATFLPAPP